MAWAWWLATHWPVELRLVQGSGYTLVCQYMSEKRHRNAGIGTGNPKTYLTGENLECCQNTPRLCGDDPHPEGEGVGGGGVGGGGGRGWRGKSRVDLAMLLAALPAACVRTASRVLVCASALKFVTAEIPSEESTIRHEHNALPCALGCRPGSNVGST